jgi:MoxR-like ATPase
MELLQEHADGSRSMRFVPGPIFANIILADEINRTPPKTQSALLESMQEYQVTAAGNEFALERPFVVVATQNPIEQEGTYPLPEAQLDRFMFMLLVDYPTRGEEEEIVVATTGGELPGVEPVLTSEQIAMFQSLVRRVPVSPHVVSYAVALARSSRPRDELADDYVRQYVEWGAGPRASQYLTLAAKSRAVIRGDSVVRSEHVREVAPQVMRHRVLVNYNATGDGVRSDDVVAHLLANVGEEAYASV